MCSNDCCCMIIVGIVQYRDWVLDLGFLQSFPCYLFELLRHWSWQCVMLYPSFQRCNECSCHAENRKRALLWDGKSRGHSYDYSDCYEYNLYLSQENSVCSWSALLFHQTHRGCAGSSWSKLKHHLYIHFLWIYIDGSNLPKKWMASNGFHKPPRRELMPSCHSRRIGKALLHRNNSRSLYWYRYRQHWPLSFGEEWVDGRSKGQAQVNWNGLNYCR